MPLSHAARRRTPRIVEWLVVLGILVFLTLFLVPVFKLRQRDTRGICANNVRTITQALLAQYADHGQVFPDGAAVWSTLKLPPDALTCPAYDARKGNAYGYVGSLGGHTLGDDALPDAAQVPVVSEMAGRGNVLRSPMDLDFRHANQINVGYADGHVAHIAPVMIGSLPTTGCYTEFLAAGYDKPAAVRPTTWQQTGAGAGAWRRLCDTTAGARRPGGAKDLGGAWRSNFAAHMREVAGQADGSWGGLSLRSPDLVNLTGNDAGPDAPCTYDGPDPDLRIPLNADAPGEAPESSAGGVWTVRLPKLLFQGLCRTTTAAACARPADPAHPPYAAVAVLDTAEQPIATFSCTVRDGRLHYALNGADLLVRPVRAVAASTGRFCPSVEPYGADAGEPQWHSLLFSQADGRVTCAFSPSGDSLLVAHGQAAALSAKPPAWLALTVKTNRAGRDTGVGSVCVRLTQEGGGFYGFSR